MKWKNVWGFDDWQLCHFGLHVSGSKMSFGMENLRRFYERIEESRFANILVVGTEKLLTKTYAILFLILVIGVITHSGLLLSESAGIGADCREQLYMGKTFWHTGEFRVYGGEYSSHYTPLIPMIYGGWLELFGYTDLNLYVLQMILLEILIIVVFLVGRHFDPRVGLFAAFLVSIDSQYLTSMLWGGGEVITAIFLMLTLYGIIRGTKDSRWMIFAGFFAGLAYLCKASTGYIFIIGGLFGLGWRFYYDRWKIFRDKGYILGIIVFGTLFGVWTIRNLIRWNDITGSFRTTEAVNVLLSQTLTTQAFLIGGLIVMFIAFTLYKVIWFAPDLKYVFKNSIKNQKYGAIVLFIGTTFLISSIIAAGFILSEHHRPAVAASYLRYISVVDGMIFLLIGIAIFRKKVKLRHIVAFLILILLMGRWLAIANESVYTLQPQHEATQIINGMNDTTIYTNQGLLLEYYGTPHVVVDVENYSEIPNGSLVFIFERFDSHFAQDYVYMEEGEDGYYEVFYKP